MLKSDSVMGRFGVYPILKEIKKADQLIPEDQTQSSMNLFTQALFRTAKKLDIPFVTANMVGKPYQVVSIRSFGLVPRASRAMINPRIVWASPEEQLVEETFILEPGVKVIRSRPQKIKVEYKNRHKETKLEEYSGRFAAYIMQAIEVFYTIPLTASIPAPSEVAARLKSKYGDKYEG